MNHEKRRLRPSYAAIGAIVLGVSAYEAWAATTHENELITDGVKDIRKSKIGNFIVQAVVWTMASHLSGLYEATGTEDLDPWRGIGKIFKKVVE